MAKPKKTTRRPRTLKQFCEYVEQFGCTVVSRGDQGKSGGHGAVLNPTGAFLMSVPFTPRDPRIWLNMASDFRKAVMSDPRTKVNS